VAACKRSGITRKTGYRWGVERGGLPPRRLAEAERGSRYLSLLERQRIATLRGQGLAVSAWEARAPSIVGVWSDRSFEGAHPLPDGAIGWGIQWAELGRFR
jgi:hypothetical protein